MNLSQALHRLARHPAWSAGELPVVLKALTEEASEALGVPRASVWWVDEVRDGIACADLYARAQQLHESGTFLPVHAAPRYFRAIRQARVIAVADAVADPRTSELADSYLKPLGVGALLDAPILVEGRLYGVVCHEDDAPRDWTPQECAFAGSIGDLAALAVQTAARRDAERALREREAELRIAVEAARAGDWSWDVANDLVRLSPQATEIFGQHEDWEPGGVVGILGLVHPDDRESATAALRAAVKQGSSYLVSYRISLPGGAIRWIETRGQVQRDSSGTALMLGGLVLDTTKQRRFDEQLARSQRLESLGRLAGGVAHDFNNILTAISGAVEILLEDCDPDSRDLLELVAASADRAGRLSSQLLAFGSRLPTRQRAVDAASVVRDTKGLLTRLIGESVTLRYHGDVPVWVWLDPSHLEQLVMNLAVNARDAMPEGGDLDIHIAELDEACHLTVRDSGTGMKPEVLERIFDPFFTTKPAGEGTGLGLAICHGIVERMGGRMSVDSEVGAGTTFTIELPLTSQRPTPSQDSAEAPPLPVGNVLVVEDDPAVAAVLLRVLRGPQREVTHAHSYEAALEALQAGPPDLLLCDMVLPGGSGAHIVERVRDEHPQVPIVMMTGYAPEAVPSGIPLLTKPFGPTELRRALAEATRTSRAPRRSGS